MSSNDTPQSQSASEIDKAEGKLQEAQIRLQEAERKLELIKARAERAVESAGREFDQKQRESMSAAISYFDAFNALTPSIISSLNDAINQPPRRTFTEETRLALQQLKSSLIDTLKIANDLNQRVRSNSTDYITVPDAKNIHATMLNVRILLDTLPENAFNGADTSVTRLLFLADQAQSSAWAVVEAEKIFRTTKEKKLTDEENQETEITKVKNEIEKVTREVEAAKSAAAKANTVSAKMGKFASKNGSTFAATAGIGLSALACVGLGSRGCEMVHPEPPEPIVQPAPASNSNAPEGYQHRDLKNTEQQKIHDHFAAHPHTEIQEHEIDSVFNRQIPGQGHALAVRDGSSWSLTPIALGVSQTCLGTILDTAEKIESGEASLTQGNAITTTGNTIGDTTTRNQFQADCRF